MYFLFYLPNETMKEVSQVGETVRWFTTILIQFGLKESEKNVNLLTAKQI